MTLRIFTYPNNYRVSKALIAAQYNGVEIEVPEFDMAKELHTAEFKAKNPLQKVPVLETPSGCIFESAAIARYVARLRADTNLLGASFHQQGLVDQFIDFSTNEIEPARAIWLAPIQGYLQYNEKANQEARKELVKSMTVLNEHLLANTFLVGNQITLADITIVCALVDLYRQVFTSKFLAPFTNVTRWFTTCVNQPEFAKVLGKVDFAKEEAQPPKAAKADKKKAEKPAAAPKEEKKAAPAPAAEEEKPKAKPVNPLDLLPESKMNLDTVKKLAFLKRPVNPEFFEQLFAEHWDNEGYSFYTADYQYDSDNTEYWKLGNLVGGFIQRSDAARKYAMGCMQLSGPEDEESSGPWSLNGVWLFRGQQVPQEMMDNPDAEYYTWTKVDVTTEEGKKKVKEYFMGDSVNGKPICDRRYFK